MTGNLPQIQKGNPFAVQSNQSQYSQVAPTGGALVEVEQQRAVAETQAAMAIAKRFPRDQRQNMDMILQACTRPTLAEAALYSYARGGTEITGPSIRLAEAVAQNWGNLQFGIRELEQRDGCSTVEAFAWDVETNVRQVKIFQVKHHRHTKKGGYDLTDPRDIYELTANQGARRLRACILGIIPGDVIDAAIKQCEATLSTKFEVTPKRITSLIEKFGKFNVSKNMIEKRIQRRVDAITPALMASLGKIYNSIKDGMSVAGDWFEAADETSSSINAEVKKITVETKPPETKPAAGDIDIEKMTGDQLKAAIDALDEETRIAAMQSAGFSNMPTSKTAMKEILKSI